MAVTFLFPSDVLETRTVDAHFRDEAAAARTLGLDVRRIDHDAVLAGDMTQAVSMLGERADTPLLYRGWMIPPHRYRELQAAVVERGDAMLVAADQFARSHHLPNWYATAEGLTAESAWSTDASIDGFITALGEIGSGPAVLKDYSKSEKAYWDEAMFIPDAADVASARLVAERFRELRDEFFDGGFVVRRFEQYEPGECRTWWVAGACVLVTAHPDTPDDPGPAVDLDDVAELPRLASVPSPFFTMDIAREQETGRLRIVEIGDGQVSDRPSSTDATEFIQAISTITW